jgi:hypothetical protein
MLKNYSTKVPANRSINEIQEALVKHGATDVLFQYEEGTGRIGALKFMLPVRGQKQAFALPVNWRRFQRVLEVQGERRAGDEDYRVAWRDIRDWVMAQMALYETAIVDMPQVFLPFMNHGNATLYDAIISGQLKLPSGENQ